MNKNRTQNESHNYLVNALHIAYYIFFISSLIRWLIWYIGLVRKYSPPQNYCCAPHFVPSFRIHFTQVSESVPVPNYEARAETRWSHPNNRNRRRTTLHATRIRKSHVNRIFLSLIFFSILFLLLMLRLFCSVDTVLGLAWSKSIGRKNNNKICSIESSVDGITSALLNCA